MKFPERTPMFDKFTPPTFVFLAIFFPKHPRTLWIPRQWVLNILKWSNGGRMLTNNGPQMKLGYDTIYSTWFYFPDP